MQTSLNGIRVLVTRPEGQADNLCQLIESHGGTAIRMPVIEIKASENLPAAEKILSQLEDYDIGIFISKNAVDWTLKLLGDKQSALESLQLIAIGSATAQALVDADKKYSSSQNSFSRDVITNKGLNSEALLEIGALAARQVNGKKIAIFRGQDGRELLSTVLKTRGAHVDYAEVYRRDCPQYDTDFIHNIWSANPPDVIVVTSNNGLQNLFSLLNPQQCELLRSKQLIVMGQRMLEFSAEFNFITPPILAEENSDEGILNTVVKWADSRLGWRDDCMSDEKTKLTPEDQVEDKVETQVQDKADDRAISESVNKTEKSGNQNRLLTVIVLILICSTLAGSFLLWRELQQTKTDLFDYVTNDQTTSGLTAENLAAMEDAIRQLEQKQIEQSLAMASLYREKQGNNEDWAIAEVEYLLIIALHRLILEENASTALAAMEAADLRLKDLGNPGLLPIRQQLATDMNRLRAVNMPDIAGVSIYLSDMVELSKELPLKPEVAATTAHVPGNSDEIDGTEMPIWKRLPLIVWQEIKSLVVIKRSGEVKQALLLPGQEYFLYQNLRLELESARLSALRSDTDNFRASINLAQSWLRQYFDVKDTAVTNVIETLDRMRPIELKPVLPDISSSLESLRAYMREAESDSSSNDEMQ